MKRITITICALLLCSFSFQLLAQSDEEKAAMQKWQEYMTPGDIHKLFAKDNGEWNEEITMWMAPNTDPVKSTATVVNTMLLGGRYQQSKHSGNMMGMPFEGIGTIGYDNAKKAIISTWIDNMGTGIMYMEGTYDQASKTINLSGTSVDPMTGNNMKVREVFKWIDDNTQQMEMYMTQNGQEFKTMEIKLTRKK
jgi:hypothetical protein